MFAFGQQTTVSIFKLCQKVRVLRHLQKFTCHYNITKYFFSSYYHLESLTELCGES